MDSDIIQVVADVTFRDAVLISAWVAVFSLLGVIFVMARELVKKHEGDHWHCKVNSLSTPISELVELHKETNKLLREQNGNIAKALMQGKSTLKAVGKLLDRQFELATRKGGKGGA